MLVKWKNSDEVYPVIAIAMDHQENVTYLYFSDFYNAHSQYRNSISKVEIVDSTIPDYWTIGVDESNNVEYISFNEWTSDPGSPGEPGFYERYVDGEPEDVETMCKYYQIELKKMKEQGFSLPEISS